MIRAVRFALSLVLVLLAAAGARADLTVALRERAALPEGYIRLAAVADLDGDAESARRVGRLFLGPVPEPGAPKVLARADVLDRLREVGLDTGVTLAGALSVTVSQLAATADNAPAISALPAPELPTPLVPEPAAPTAAPAPARPLDSGEFNPAAAKLVQTAVQRHLLRQIGGEGVEASVECRQADAWPAGTKDLEVMKLVKGALPGWAVLRLAARDASGRKLGEIEAAVETKLTTLTPVLRRPLPLGATITQEDLGVVRQPLVAGSTYLPAKAELLVGKTASRALSAMTPLRVGDLAEPLAVERNKIVVLDSSSGGFHVRGYVKALADARLRETVMVQNPETGKRFMAVAVGPGTVDLPQAERNKK